MTQGSSSLRKVLHVTYRYVLLAFLVPLGGVSKATEPPSLLSPLPRPDPIEPAVGDCESAQPVRADHSIHCNAVALPPADLADLLADREWAFALKKQYELDTAYLL